MDPGHKFPNTADPLFARSGEDESTCRAIVQLEMSYHTNHHGKQWDQTDAAKRKILNKEKEPDHILSDWRYMPRGERKWDFYINRWFRISNTHDCKDPYHDDDRSIDSDDSCAYAPGRHYPDDGPANSWITLREHCRIESPDLGMDAHREWLRRDRVTSEYGSDDSDDSNTAVYKFVVRDPIRRCWRRLVSMAKNQRLQRRIRYLRHERYRIRWDQLCPIRGDRYAAWYMERWPRIQDMHDSPLGSPWDPGDISEDSDDSCASAPGRHYPDHGPANHPWYPYTGGITFPIEYYPHGPVFYDTDDGY